MKKILSISLIALSLFLTSCNVLKLDKSDKDFINEYYTNYISEEFDQNNILLTFGAMSDIHMGGEGQEKKLNDALYLLKKRTNDGLDALLFVGDLTNTGKTEEMIKFRDIVNKNKGKDTSIISCFGVNHDHKNKESGVTQRKLFYDTFGKDFYKSDVLNADEMTEGIRHCVVKGYHFITVDWEIDGYPESTLKWLDTTLKSLTDADPLKPIVVAVHMPPDSILNSILSKYPQVICFTGHKHIPMNSDRGIIQNGYTRLECGGMFYYRQYTFDNETVGEMGDIYKFCQGYLVEIDKNNNVRVIRMDFANKDTYKPEWIIPSPKEDKSHLLKYPTVRSEASKRPYFEEDAKMTFDETLIRTLKAVFDKAVSDSYNPVDYYEVLLWQKREDKDYPEKTYISSQYPLYSDPNKLPEQYEFTFFKEDAPFAVSISAYDCHGTSSSKLLYQSGKYYFVNIIVEGGNADIKINNLEYDIYAAEPGDIINLDMIPDNSYKIENISYEGITTADNTFEMPANNVVITVTLSELSN